MNEEHSLEEVIISGNERIEEISRHPAVVQDAIMKKNDACQVMDVDSDDDLIDLANTFVAKIDDTIKIIFKTVQTSYSKRFPELKIPDPMQYILTVQLLANKPDRITDESVKDQLADIVDPKMHLLITMTAATTQGIKLEPDEMNSILHACSVAVHLSNLRQKLLSFVESNMAKIAPNLSVILGAPIAAKLMGLAGGIRQLAFMPSCNIPIMGSHRVSKIESDINAPPRAGLIYECDLIQKIPFDYTKDVRERAIKWVANKCVLAARCDASLSDLSGNSGRLFREKIEALINKQLEPPPKKAPRPLPAPIDKSGKKRGGKRARRQKERYAQTALRKAANREDFGVIGDDPYQNDLGFGRNQLSAIQKLRGPQINEKTKIRLSNGTQKKLAAQAASNVKAATAAAAEQGSGGGGESNGNRQQSKAQTSTSITLTPEQQSLKIYNPKAKESYTVGTSGESSNYFSHSAGFSYLKQEPK